MAPQWTPASHCVALSGGFALSEPGVRQLLSPHLHYVLHDAGERSLRLVV